MMFTEVPFLDRFDAAASAGFGAVEFLFPYEFKKTEISDRLTVNRLTIAPHNLPAGDWARGERGIACHPGRVAEFQAGVEVAVDYATELNCPRLNCLAGILPAGVGVDEARATLTENLRYAASRLEMAGITLLLEPVNSRDDPEVVADGWKSIFCNCRTAREDARVVMDHAYAELKRHDDQHHCQPNS
jgi:hydroxypyruvate isomerase